MQMRDVNNLLDCLKGIQREVATYIILEVSRARLKEYTVDVNMLSRRFYTNRDTISNVTKKLKISEIVSVEKQDVGIYKFKRYNWQSFDQVAKILEVER